MKQLINFINALYARFLLTARDQKGQGLVEYALILVLVAIVVIAMLMNVGGSSNNAFSTVNSALVQPS
ncbi:Flp family type IVb pilin [Geobacter hydrogenophilus]|uniref:Flp family type IVb pilin n=1 Tax=Geobacter hydrogenophilus TaxID=40983 RepID=A0A9W6G157_9BACT|nr:Flp family type IVb pilin [Geobacter hydrogenophilus]MBT0893226.1 Flp family type IVb pilin [Geobacter hydrogenophilus]GLI38929.1 hypothetical protein GHYDROH2_24300 [Geobacter hydrogenophilus]